MRAAFQYNLKRRPFFWCKTVSDRHIQSQPFAEADISTNKIERWHSTLKTRTNIMRGLKSLESAQDFLDAWLVHYNYFRKHESLNDKTPAEVARVSFPFRDWLDVVESKRITTKPIETEIRKLPVREQVQHYQYPTYKGQIKRKVKRIRKSKRNKNKTISVVFDSVPKGSIR